MRWLAMLRLRVRSLLRAGQVDHELDEELRFHLDHLIEEYIEAGMPPTEARYKALREMGATEQRKEECRDARGVAFIDSLRQDVSYAVRALCKAPAFSVVAVLLLAIGIGANTTIFSFVNAILLRPLPYPGSDRLVVLRERTRDSIEPLNVHPLHFAEWRARARSFESLVLTQSPPLNVIGSTGAEQVSRLLTTPELFRVFNVSPTLGRGFTDDEGRPGGQPAVVLGYGFWQRWFGGDPLVLGRQLPVQDGSLTIVGVAPEGFRIGVVEPDVFTPLTIDPANPAATGSRAFDCYARLKAGVTLEEATAEMDVIAAALGQQYPTSEGMGVMVSSLHDYLVRDARPGLRLLMAVVAILLAIACLNLAGLVLARGMARRGEFAIRAALGASRERLARQLVTEGLLLAFCGGVVGLTIAYFMTGALVGLSREAITAGASEAIRLDVVCLVFTFAVSTATALAFGLGPARQAGNVDPQDALRERTRAATHGRRQQRTRAVLVATQVALSLVLLVGAGLLGRTLFNLVRIDLGFQPAGTVTMGLFLGVRPPDARIATLDQILDRVESLPEVTAVGTIQFLPLAGMTCGTGFWHEEDAQGQDPSRTRPTECALVSRGYFAAMGIPVLEGRPFDRHDRLGSPRVVVVNHSFARRYFPDGGVLGRRVLVQSSDQALAEIIGVVGDVRHTGLTSDPAPTVFLLHAQTPGYITNLVARTTGDPLAQAAAIRRAVHDVDPTQAVSGIRTLEQHVASLLARPRLYAVLVAGFALIAVTLAAVGIYGLIAYTVTQRTHEIGIRLALGATPEHIFLAVLGHGTQLVGAGLVAGLAAALVLRRIVSTLVFGVDTSDAVTYALAVLTLSGIAVVAVIIPARRASQVQPVNALRLE